MYRKLLWLPLTGLALLAVSAHAQFLGGSGDGFHTGDALGLNLDGTTAGAWPAGITLGGSGDGFGGGTLLGVNLNGTTPGPWPAGITLGGAGDGFHSIALSGIALDGSVPGPWPASIMQGGGGDGHHASTSVQYQFQFSFGAPASWPTWRTALFTPAEIAGGLGNPATDADLDGLSNALEYAAGGDPRSPSPGAGAYVAINDLTPYGFAPGLPKYLSLVASRSPFAIDAISTIEASSSLASWSSSEVVVLINTPSLLIARDQDPVSARPRRFLRWKVTLLGQ